MPQMPGHETSISEGMPESVVKGEEFLSKSQVQVM